MVSEQSSHRPAGTTSVGNGPKHALQVATAEAIAHHGELLQGVFEGSDGRLHRGLLTLPFPKVYQLKVSKEEFFFDENEALENIRTCQSLRYE